MCCDVLLLPCFKYQGKWNYASDTFSNTTTKALVQDAEFFVVLITTLSDEHILVTVYCRTKAKRTILTVSTQK